MNFFARKMEICGGEDMNFFARKVEINLKWGGGGRGGQGEM